MLYRTAHARTEFRFSAEPARWKEAHATELFQQVTIMWHCLIGFGCRLAGSTITLFFPSACVVSDYMKGEHVSDLDIAFWFAAAEVSCCIFILVIERMSMNCFYHVLILLTGYLS